MWKLVRKGTASAFQAVNMRCIFLQQLPISLTPPSMHGPLAMLMHAWSKVSSVLSLIQCAANSSLNALCRQFHTHVVDVVNRLVEGIKAKGSGAVVNFADIGQVSRQLPVRFLYSQMYILPLSLTRHICFIQALNLSSTAAVNACVTICQKQSFKRLRRTLRDACGDARRGKALTLLGTWALGRTSGPAVT